MKIESLEINSYDENYTGRITIADGAGNYSVAQLPTALIEKLLGMYLWDFVALFNGNQLDYTNPFKFTDTVTPETPQGNTNEAATDDLPF